MDGGREGRKKGEKEDTEGEKGGTEGEKEKGRGKVREEEGSGRKTQLCDSVQAPLHFIAEELGNKVPQKTCSLTSLSSAVVCLFPHHHLSYQPDHIERPHSINSENTLEVLQGMRTFLCEGTLCNTNPSTVDCSIYHSIFLLSNLNGVLDV